MITIDEFLKQLDNIDNIIDISLRNSLDQNSTDFEINVLNYINENFPSLVIPKGPILEIAEDGYKLGTIKFKENLKFKVADTKYKLTEEKIENEIIDELNKFNLLFSSIELGSNINYLDYIKNTLGNIMKYLVDKSNGSMTFAKNSMKVREEIEKMINLYFMNTMKSYGKNIKYSFKIEEEQKNLNLVNAGH